MWEGWPGRRIGNEVGDLSRGQIIKGLDGLIREFGLYPKGKRKAPNSFKQGHMTRFTMISSFHLVSLPDCRSVGLVGH